MLTKLTERSELEKYMEKAYSVAMDLSKSCYPTYTDGIKTKEDFVVQAKKALVSECKPIYLYSYENIVEGWIQYEFIPEDKYLQIVSLCVEIHIEQAIEELLEHLENHFTGYECYFGCSQKNKTASRIFLRHGFSLIDKSYHYKLNLKDYILQPSPKNVKKITQENYRDFRLLHQPSDDEVYWNCDRIYSTLEQWEIYVYYEENVPQAAIYISKSELLSEVFGINYKADVFQEKAMESLMIASLNALKELNLLQLVYFCEEFEMKILDRFGFQNVDVYQCYKKEIEKRN